MDPNANRVSTKMARTGSTVTATTTHDVAFGYNPGAYLDTGYLVAKGANPTNEFVAHSDRRLESALGPLVPLVDVQVGAADGCVGDIDQNIVGANPWSFYLD
jgi:hypothetical protein